VVEADGGYNCSPVSNARININTVQNQIKEETEDAEFHQILLRNGLVRGITVRITP